jgi:hypothetical protein
MFRLFVAQSLANRLAWRNKAAIPRPSGSVVRAAAFAVALSGLWNVGWAQQINWLHEFGTQGDDDGTAVAAHASGVYAVGRVQGALPGQTAGGAIDGFVRKYDFWGVEIWTRQFSFNDHHTEPFAIAVDDTGVYLAGRAFCRAGGAAGNRCGAFARKMDHNGKSIWTHFFEQRGGTSPLLGEAHGIAVGSSGIYVAGSTSDARDSIAVLSRLDPLGNEIWTRTAGAPNPATSTQQAIAAGVAVHSTGVYVAGDLGTADVRRFDVNGNVTAAYGIGTIHGGVSESLVVDDSGIYVSGRPVFSASGSGAAVRKYAHDGAILWTSELPDRLIIGGDLAGDQHGIYLAGVQPVPFVPDEPPVLSRTAYVRRYDKDDGELAWTVNFGAPDVYTAAAGVAAHAGKVYVTGFAQAVVVFDATQAFVAQVSPNTLPLVPSEIRPEKINPRSKGVVSLVIFSTPDFDATRVDPLSVRFGRGKATEVHKRGHLSDVDGDGYTDIVLHFSTPATGIACGDTKASFTGKTFAREAIRGADSIATAGCK